MESFISIGSLKNMSFVLMEIVRKSIKNSNMTTDHRKL
jgi:hypothetical protein